MKKKIKKNFVNFDRILFLIAGITIGAIIVYSLLLVKSSKVSKVDVSKAKLLPEIKFKYNTLLSGIDEPKTKKEQYNVVLAEFSDSSEADQYKAMLTLLGFKPNLTQKIINNTKVNTVYLGPYKSMREANGIIEKLKSSNVEKSIIIKTTS